MYNFTLARKSQKYKRVVMKAAPGFNPEDLLDEIKDKIIMVSVEVEEMKTSNPQLESHSYLASFTNKINLNEVKNITG